MKNMLKIASILGLILCAVGFMFKVQHWPGASLTILIGSSLLFYYFMFAFFEAEPGKKFLSFLLNLGFALFVLGTLFKTFHWPGSSMFLSICLGMLFPIYSLIQSISSFKRPTHKVAHFIFYFGATFLPFGVLFWIMHWPGVSFMLAISCLGLTLMTGGGAVIFTAQKNEKSFTMNHFVSTVVVCMWLLQSISIRVPNWVLDNSVVIYNDIERQANIELESGNALLETEKSSQEMQKIDSSTARCIALINEIKLHILASSGEDLNVSKTNDYTAILWKKYDKNNPLKPAELNLFAVGNKFQFDVPHNIMAGDEVHTLQGEGKELWQSLLDYRRELIHILSGSKPKEINDFKDASDLNKQCSKMLEKMNIPEGERTALAALYMGLTKPAYVRSLEGENIDFHWIHTNFGHFPLVNAMVQLSRLELEVLQARTKALKILATKSKVSGDGNTPSTKR